MPGPGAPSSSRVHPLAFAFVSLLGGMACCLPFLRDETLFWDNKAFYSCFRDNLDSLTRFGEPAWWFPRNQAGFPGYFLSILSQPQCGGPLYVPYGIVCWAIGRLGFAIDSYHALYVLHFGFFVPTLFLVAVAGLSSRLIRSSAARLYLLILCAFSPGVVANVRDIGFLEQTAYGIFFAWAFVDFLRSPSRGRFWLGVLAAGVLGVTVGYCSLVWNVFFLPLFLACVLASGRLRRAAVRAFLSLPRADRIVAPIVVLVCTLPNLIVLSQIGDLFRTPLGKGVHYTFERIQPGNPFAVVQLSGLWYSYLGLLAVPLYAVGLLYGRPILRTRLLIASAFCFFILMPAAYSPFFAPVLLVPSPLRSMNHYCDLTFATGAFFIVAFGAGVGLDSVLRGEGRSRKVLLAVALSFVVLNALQAAVAPASTAIEQEGFRVAMGLIQIVPLFLALGSATGTIPRPALRMLFAFVLIDVSTYAFWSVRTMSALDRERNLDGPRADGLGVASVGANRYADSVLTSRAWFEILETGVVRGDIPEAALYARAFEQADFSRQDLARAVSRSSDRAIALAPPARREPAFAPFFEPGERLEGPGKSAVEVRRPTYNRSVLEVDSPSAAILFFRDCAWPGWTATVNGAAAPVARALGTFKAVAVPAGRSTVEFRFRPAGVALSFVLAYSALTGMAVAAAVLLRRERVRIRATGGPGRPESRTASGDASGPGGSVPA